MGIITTALGYSTLIWAIRNMSSRPMGVLSIKYKLVNKVWNDRFCLKCVTFWITLGLTLNPFTAAIAAFSSYIIDNYLNTVKF